jgi:hypothetical protein
MLEPVSVYAVILYSRLTMNKYGPLTVLLQGAPQSHIFQILAPLARRPVINRDLGEDMKCHRNGSGSCPIVDAALQIFKISGSLIIQLVSFLVFCNAVSSAEDTQPQMTYGRDIFTYYFVLLMQQT